LNPPCPADGMKGFHDFLNDKAGIQKYDLLIEKVQSKVNHYS